LTLGEATNEEEGIHVSLDEQRVLHYVHSPFRPAVRDKENVNEIRDKNMLWYYVKARTQFKNVLCLDGDEVLSLEALRQWSEIEKNLDHGVDMITIPFVYLWDSESQARVDGIYGDAEDGHPKLRFPRIFTIQRISDQNLFDQHFSWEGTKGGFHCGSIPMVHFETSRPHAPLNGRFIPAPVAHYGYVDDPLRQRKFKFYREIDPGNKVEGEYLHIIGEPDLHAPGPLEFKPWEDK
jgi:hypothetical protein